MDGLFAYALVLIVLAVVVAIGRACYRALTGRGAPDVSDEIGQIIYDVRRRARKLRVVCIGGGTGLSTLLRGLKGFNLKITAVVTVSDDGGSSGRLRQELGILPPGDIRNCILALAEAEPLMKQLFQYRFEKGHQLAGHSFGNLFIAAMTEVSGDFEEAVRQFSRILNVRGQVLPSTLSNVELEAEMEDGRRIRGESNISGAKGRIKRVYLIPHDARPVPEAVTAISEADVVVIGPGSLYTSILPGLLVSGIAQAVRKTRAVRVFVVNVMTQPGETDGFSASDHVDALTEHLGPGMVDWVLLNGRRPPEEVLAKYRAQGAHPVIPDTARMRHRAYAVFEADLLDSGDLARHDPEKLARAIIKLAVTRTGRKRIAKRWRGR